MKAKKRGKFLALVVTGLVLVSFIYFRSPTAYSRHLDSRYGAMQALGEFLRATDPNCKVLLLGNPFVQRPEASDKIKDHDVIGTEGLAAGLGNLQMSLRKVYPSILESYLDSPETVLIPANSKNPLSFIMDKHSVEALLKSHPDHSVVVSLVGLPLGIDKLDCWQDGSDVSFALLQPDLRILGSKKQILQDFARGKILAVVLQDPNSEDPQIVDRHNIKDFIQSHPDLLGW